MSDAIDPKPPIEHLIALYTERLKTDAEEAQTSAMYNEELSKIQARRDELDAEIRALADDVQPLMRLLGGAAEQAVAHMRQPSLGSYTPRDGAETTAFRHYIAEHAGKLLKTADIQRDLAKKYSKGTISGWLTHYKNRGVIENVDRGVWKVSTKFKEV